MNQSTTKIPTWFWVVTGILLLWNLMGVASFFAHLNVGEEMLQAMSEAERDLYGRYPLWTKIVFAIATFGGALGCIALLMRRKWAKTILVVSLIAIIIQMGHSLFIAGALEVYGAKHAIMPGVVVLIGAVLVWFAGYCDKQGWLR